MKWFLTTVICCLAITLNANNEKIIGKWYGAVDIYGNILRLEFDITANNGTLSANMISVDQGGVSIPVSSITYSHEELKLAIENIGFSYEGKLQSDSIVGDMQQQGMRFPLILNQKYIEKKIALRPQNPVKPYPYKEEFVNITNGDVTLAGTLTLPQSNKPVPAVILISGSGAQNRDEELMEHKPFLVIADYLTRHGIAVLRYDDRGFGESTGDFATATTTDFASDATAALNYLKTRQEINPNQLGAIGHSEGGIIAPMVAAADKSVAFIVLLAGTGVPGDSIIIMQADLLSEAMGIPAAQREAARNFNRSIYAMAKNGEDTNAIATHLESYFDKESAMTQAKMLTTPWFKEFLNYDPAPTLEQVSCRVLALNGTKDLQVPYKENLEAIEAALKRGGNSNYQIHAIEGLNHLFQHSTTGHPNEYSLIEETIAPEVLEIITTFILEK